MDKINFIFPQNYNFKNKLFGFFDYSTVIINTLWAFIMFQISKNLPYNINVKISVFIVFYFPLLLFSMFGFNNENIFYFFSYMIKFIKNRKVYFFSK